MTAISANDTGEIFRTPDERFANLPDFPYQPQYREWRGMRLAHIDEGDGPIVLLLHGDPTWSFLWREPIKVLVEAGYRCVAPDLPGFGRSDKPTNLDWYTYDLFTDSLRDLIESLDLRGITYVVHDWGGPIALRNATELPERTKQFVAMDTGIFTGSFKMSENWQQFAEFVAHNEDMPIGFLVKGAVAKQLDDDVVAAYEAPFPTVASKAGARAFPPMIPQTEDNPDAVTGRRVLDALASADWPKLVIWADGDPVLPRKLGSAFAARINADEPHWIEDASHFLQEDHGREIGEIIAKWIRQND